MYLIWAEQEECCTLNEITDMKQHILQCFSCLNLLQVYLSTAVKKIICWKSELEKTETSCCSVGFQLVLTNVNTSLSEFVVVGCFFSLSPIE